VFALTRHFLQQSAKQLGVEPKRISDAALQQLSKFGFPGNVRQLENICHWLTVMAPAQVIESKDLPPEVIGTTAVEAPKPSTASAQSAMAQAPASQDNEPAVTSMPELSGPALAGKAMVVNDDVSRLPGHGWEADLELEAQALLATGRSDVWDVLSRRFESKLIQTALLNTRGRRIEAAQKLGIGRNTITRKIQELNLE
jgi:two-component system nitrogen regulation response regulator GlnG